MTKISEHVNSQNRIFYWLFMITMMIGLYQTTRVNYLLFHSIAELFSVVVAASVFIITWNSVKYIENPYLITVGISYLFIGIFDLLHTLAYKGMPIFTDYDYYANQLWIAARAMEGITLLAAFILLFAKKKARVGVLFLCYSTLTILLVASIFYWKIFPVCFVEGQGLTNFKIYSEYAICLILVVSILLLIKNRSMFAGSVYKLILLSIIYAIISELFFTFYIDNYGISNIAGHYFKIFSFVMIYQAIISTGTAEPYRLIFKELSVANANLQNEIELRKKTEIDLESKITEHKQAEVALCENEQRFRLATEATGVGIWEWNVLTNQIRWDLQMFRIYGITPTEDGFIQYSDWRGAVLPDDLPQQEEILQNTALRGGRSAREFRIQRREDRECRNIQAVETARTNAQGQIEWVIGTNLDITVRNRAEESLRESEQFNNAVLNTVGSLVVVLDMEGCILRFNQACEAATGYAAGEVMGRIFWEFLVPHEELEGVRLTWERLQAGDFPNSHENHWITQDGSHRLVTWTNTAIVRNGKVVYVIGSGLDITERRQAEEQIKAALAEKEVMLKEIHHRVKNNLQVISSLVSLQSDNLTDERMRDDLNDVRDRVRTMALVHEKLYETSDLARLNFADYAASLLRSLWRSHSTLAEQVRLTLALAPVALSIEAAVPCGLILNELAGNALKHAFPNSRDGELTVGLKHDAATGTACLRVHDNGVGLPEGLDWRQSRSLGLRLVQILTNQLRGTVDVGTGPGTEFQITFPSSGFQS